MVGMTFGKPWMDFEVQAAQRGDFGPLPEQKKFKKGDRVIVIGQWDRRGTMYLRRGTVHSCGQKVMRLKLDVKCYWHESNYSPHGDDPRTLLNGCLGSVVMPLVDDVRAEEIALNISKARLAYLQHSATQAQNKGDMDMLMRVTESMHEFVPSVIWPRA